MDFRKERKRERETITMNSTHMNMNVKTNQLRRMNRSSQCRRLSVDFFDESVFEDDNDVLSIGTAIIGRVFSTVRLSVVLLATVDVVGASCVAGSKTR